jgi:non-specific serine/threonine protein kinase
MEPRRDQPASPLTAREREVAALIAQGRTNREIAAALVITPGTARTHVEHIMTKLDVHTRAQVATWAVARGGVETAKTVVGQVHT